MSAIPRAPATLAPTERAKRAVAVVFVVNGLAFASWVSRVPAIRDTLALSPGQVGLLLLALSAGTLLALPLSGVVVGRWGPARTVLGSAGVLLTGLLVMALGLAGETVVGVAVGMFGYGVGTSTWDVAMNVEAADVERRAGRTLMPRFHAGFSAGTVAGALLGAGCARVGVGLDAQLVATAVLVVLAAPPALRSFLPVAPVEEAEQAGYGVARAWREPRTLLIGVMVLAFALAEGVANDWLALALVDGYRVGEAAAAAGFGVFVAAMTLGRLYGGALVERRGRAAVLRLTGLLVAAGVGALVLSPNLAGAMTGALLWGLGASLGFPLGMSAAADEGPRAAARVSVVSSIGYTAFLGGPPLVGLLAEQVGVRDAVTVAAVAGLAGATLSAVAVPRRHRRV